MSKYSLNIKDNLSFESEIKELANILNKNDFVSIYTSENIPKESIVKIIESENLSYNYISNENKDYIIVKK